jgi:hypothetical protein
MMDVEHEPRASVVPIAQVTRASCVRPSPISLTSAVASAAALHWPPSILHSLYHPREGLARVLGLAHTFQRYYARDGGELTFLRALAFQCFYTHDPPIVVGFDSMSFSFWRRPFQSTGPCAACLLALHLASFVINSRNTMPASSSAV